MRHWMLLWLIIAAGVVAVALLFEKTLQISLTQPVQDFVTRPGPVAALLIFALLGLDLLLPVPSSLLMMLSGGLFGPVGGGLIALLGSLAGNLAGFELARKYGISLAQRLVGTSELRKMDRRFTRYGPLAIILSRPLPVVMETLSLLAGLSTMRRRTFLWTSLLGTTPVCFVYAYAGAFALQSQRILPVLLLGVGVSAVTWAVAHRVLRKPA